MQPLGLMAVGMTRRSRSLHCWEPRGDWPGGAGTRTACPVRGKLLRGLCEVSPSVTPPSPSASLPASGWWSPALLLIRLPELAGVPSTDYPVVERLGGLHICLPPLPWGHPWLRAQHSPPRDGTGRGGQCLIPGVDPCLPQASRAPWKIVHSGANTRERARPEG